MRDSWLTLRALGTGPSRPGLLVATRGHRGPSQVARDSWLTAGPRTLPDSPGRVGRNHGPSGTGPSRQELLLGPEGNQTQARVGRDSWSTRWALGHGPVSPRTAVRHPGHRAQSESPGRPGGRLRPSGTGPRCPGDLVDPEGTETRPQVTRTAGRLRGPSDTGLCPPEELVEPAGDRKSTRLHSSRLSASRPSGHHCVSPRRTRQHHGP